MPTASANARIRLAALLFLAMPALAQSPAPTPPQRPTQLPAQPPRPAPPAAAPQNQPPPSLERINAYFNAMKGLQADFTQLSPDGRRYGGVLYLLRPGRLRFEYHPPAALEIVADGRSVAVIDRKINEQNLYFIGQTPLKFLLASKIDVAKDSIVTDLKRVGRDIVLNLEDRSTFGGTSRIRIVFEGESYALKEWTVSDPQGNDTRVTLSNVDLAALPDKSLFVIDDQRTAPPRN